METVSLNFGGLLKKPLELKAGIQFILNIQKVAGVTMDKLDMNDMNTIFIMIVASARWKKPNLELDDVYKWVDQWAEKLVEDGEATSTMEGLMKVMEELAKVMNALLGAEETPSEQ